MLPVAYFILDAALKSTLVLSAAWAAGLLMKNHSAASRHLMRAIALAGCLLLPLFSLLLPSWHVRGLPQYVSTAEPPPNSKSTQPIRSRQAQGSCNQNHSPQRTQRYAEDAEKTGAGCNALLTESLQAAGIPTDRNTEKIRNVGTSVSQRTLVKSSDGRMDVSVAAVPEATENRAAMPDQLTAASAQLRGTGSRRLDWRFFLGFGWLLGAAIFVLRLLLAEFRVRRLVHNATPVRDQLWGTRLQTMARAAGIRRTVALLISQETEVPLTTGALHPKVVLSPDFEDWRPLRGDAVLRHELAHIQRMDAITHALANLAVAMYWFHPLVWKTVITMRAEGERACDDCVLAAGTRASEYAHELLEIAASLRQPDYTAALAMARRSELEGRVMAILNPKLRRGSVSRNAFLAVVILMLAVALPLAAVRPSAAQSGSSAAKIQKPSPAKPASPVAPSKPAAAPTAPAHPQDVNAVPAPPTAPVEAEEPEGVSEPEELPEISASDFHRMELAVAAAEAEIQRADADLAAEDLQSDRSKEQLEQNREQIAKLRAEIEALNAEIRALREQHLPALAGTGPAMAEYQNALKAFQDQASTLKALRDQFTASYDESAQLKALRDQSAVWAKQSAEMKALQGKIGIAFSADGPEMRALSAQLAAQATAMSKAFPALAAAGKHEALLAQRAAAAGNQCLSAGSTRSIQINSENDHRRWNMSWSGKECTASVHAEGNFVFTAEGTEIQSISPGGFIEIKEHQGDTTRHLKVTPSSSSLNYALTVNGKQQLFDDKAQEWLAGYLLAFDDGWQRF
ncbi:MAG: hypothetical protein LAP21_11635 [Acidobacteriia bacterium]|nr:hypothetical protein [Terriglobia bacterium]